MGWTCSMQITNACSTLGRKTLFGIVGFRAGMKLKTFRECCTQHHSTATCQPYNHLRSIINFVTSLAGVFAHYAFTPSPSYSKCTLLPSILPTPAATVVTINSRAASYYDVAWGLTKVLLKEKGLAAVRWLRRVYLVEARNFNDSLRHSEVSKLSYGLTRFFFMNCLQNATLAPSLSRLFLPLFVFLT